MDKDERSLLLFFECAFVDHGGLVSVASMNEADMAIARRWTAENYVKFERICSRDLRPSDRKNHCVWMSDKAVDDAQAERRARAKRRWESRTRQTVSEYRSEAA